MGLFISFCSGLAQAIPEIYIINRKKKKNPRLKALNDTEKISMSRAHKSSEMLVNRRLLYDL